MRNGQAIQPKYGWKEVLGKTATVTLSWGVNSAGLAALFLVLTITFVPLGPRFTPSIIAACILAVPAAGLVTALEHRNTREKSQISSRWTFNQKQRKIIDRSIIPVGLLVLVALIAICLTFIEIRENANAAKSEAALQKFVVTSYLGNGPEFETEAFNQTLAELEDSYQSLKDHWILPSEAKAIQVQLFRDLKGYQAMTGKERTEGHLWCSEEFGPVVAIPLEKAPSTSNDDAVSRTPMHEMVHTLMCQSIGQEGFLSIPSWFHEGIAMRHHTTGFQRFWVRGFIRTRTWWNREKFLHQEDFCNKHPSTLDEGQQKVFYDTAMEFVRFLESGHGLDTLNLISDDVRTGTTFDKSMRTRLGGTCLDLYSNWKESF